MVGVYSSHRFLIDVADVIIAYVVAVVVVVVVFFAESHCSWMISLLVNIAAGLEVVASLLILPAKCTCNTANT